jgi:phosphatidylinositol kinase/protein kinase (PI-3  family)
MQRELPWDALRHCLRRRAAHPEAWLAVRATYTASLAASSAAGYLVGLGDRHLANLLVVEGSGAVVPIDFGYAFGTAVLVRTSQRLCSVLHNA